MKTKLFLLVLMVFPIAVLGQITKENLSEVKVRPPLFTGVQNVVVNADNSDQLIDNYIAENFKYPESAINFCEQGTGVIRFNVLPNGELTDFYVVNSVCPELDEAFLEVLKSTSGKWNAGLNNGNKVVMEKEVSMMFFSDWVTNNPVDYFLKVAQNKFSKANNLFIKKGKAKKALKYYNESVKYLPYQTSSLLFRGLCKYELGDTEAACSDWSRINQIGGYDADPFIENLCGMKGYADMTQILDINED